MKLFASIFDFGTAFVLLKNDIVLMFRHDLIRFGEKITEIAELPITTETNGFPLISLGHIEYVRNKSNDFSETVL